MKDETAPLEEIIARHEELIISLGKALTEITNAVRGQPPKGSSWGTHDVEKRVKRRLAQDEALIRQALEALENPDRMIEIEPNHWEYIREPVNCRPTHSP